MGIIPHAKDVRPERDYKVDLVWKFASSLVQGSLTDPGSRQVASCPDRGVQPIEIKLLELLGRRISLALGSSNPTDPYYFLNYSRWQDMVSLFLYILAASSSVRYNLTNRVSPVVVDTRWM